MAITVRNIVNLDASAWPTPLQTNVNSNGNPCAAGLRSAMARDANGRLWAVYPISATGLRVVYSDNLAQSWNIETTITAPNNSRLSLQIILDHGQQPWILCLDASSGLVRFSRRTSPSNWTALANCGSTSFPAITTGTANRMISACIDPDSALHIFAVDSAASDAEGWYVTNVSGAFTSTKVFTDAATTDSLGAVIACDSDGFIHLLYRYRKTSSSTGTKIRYFKKAASDAFPELNEFVSSSPGVEEVVSNSDTLTIGDPCQMIDMAIDVNGNPHVSYVISVTAASAAQTVRYAHKTSPTTWVDELVENDNARAHYCTSIAVTKSGIVYIAWQEMSTTLSGDDEIVLATKTSSWSIQTLLGGSGLDKCWPNVMHFSSLKLGVYPGVAKTGIIGVYCDFDAASGVDYNLFFTDDWAPDDGAELSPEGPPEYAAETNFASIVLQGEGAPIATYPLAPYFAVPSSRRWVSSREESDGGWETTFPISPVPRTVFSVHHDSMTASEALVLQSFLDTVKASARTFWIVPPGSDAPIVARLVEERAPIAKVAPGIFSVELLVEEAFQ